jgi:hypothetical protein
MALITKRWFFVMVKDARPTDGMTRVHAAYVRDDGTKAAEITAAWAKAKSMALELNGVAEEEAIECDVTPDINGVPVTSVTGNREYRYADKDGESQRATVTDGKPPAARAQYESKVKQVVANGR